MNIEVLDRKKTEVKPGDEVAVYEGSTVRLENVVGIGYAGVFVPAQYPGLYRYVETDKIEKVMR